MEFKPYSKIPRFDNLEMVITQKIHGTNAAVVIEETDDGFIVKAQSRTRFITPDNDNYGFAQFVENNKGPLIASLGLGVHYGEWAGPGINSGEGLSERKFVLFDHWNQGNGRILPDKVVDVPVLYKGQLDSTKINECLNDLKINGSRLCPGFMRPEGVVVSFNGQKFKVVFEAEETGWKQSNKIKVEKQDVDVSHLLQPIRLEKLLSRDETYLKTLPKSLGVIARDYLKDLEEEGQLTSASENEQRSLKKAVYPWLKIMLKI